MPARIEILQGVANFTGGNKLARQRISEYKAKSLILNGYNKYGGVSCNTSNVSSVLNNLPAGQSYVVKVDEGIKKRLKGELMAINIPKAKVREIINKLSKKGFQNFIIEPFVEHNPESEKYLSLEHTRDGFRLFYSSSGGVDVEEHPDRVKIIEDIENSGLMIDLAEKLSVEVSFLEHLLERMRRLHIVFLEINPFVTIKNKTILLDCAAEVDSAGEFFVDGAWTAKDFITAKSVHPAEALIQELAHNSPSSFVLKVLNEQGSLFLLMSGGGASLALVDEIYQRGFGSQIGNYGEYSGDPTADEAYTYAQAVIQLLLNSKARKKALVVGGGVANFTDIYRSLSAIIRALSPPLDELKKQGIKVFVRRGGPRGQEALNKMEEFLSQNKLLGSIHGPEAMLTVVIKEACNFLTL